MLFPRYCHRYILKNIPVSALYYNIDTISNILLSSYEIKLYLKDV